MLKDVKILKLEAEIKLEESEAKLIKLLKMLRIKWPKYCIQYHPLENEFILADNLIT